MEFLEASKGVYTVVAVSRDVRELKGLIAKPAKPVSVDAMKARGGQAGLAVVIGLDTNVVIRYIVQDDGR